MLNALKDFEDEENTGAPFRQQTLKIDFLESTFYNCFNVAFKEFSVHTNSFMSKQMNCLKVIF